MENLSLVLEDMKCVDRGEIVGQEHDKTEMN